MSIESIKVAFKNRKHFRVRAGKLFDLLIVADPEQIAWLNEHADLSRAARPGGKLASSLRPSPLDGGSRLRRGAASGLLAPLRQAARRAAAQARGRSRRDARASGRRARRDHAVRRREEAVPRNRGRGATVVREVVLPELPGLEGALRCREAPRRVAQLASLAGVARSGERQARQREGCRCDRGERRCSLHPRHLHRHGQTVSSASRMHGIGIGRGMHGDRWMPSSWQARWILSAISPRLAIRTFSKT